MTPQTLAAVPGDVLRAAGVSANKLASLRDLSAKILDGSVDLIRPYRSVIARYCWAAVALLRGGTDPALR